MESSSTDLLPYYLICKTCKWEEWVEEPNWLTKCLDHIKLSTNRHTSIITFGDSIKYTSEVIDGVVGARYRDLFVQ